MEFYQTFKKTKLYKCQAKNKTESAQIKLINDKEVMYLTLNNKNKDVKIMKYLFYLAVLVLSACTTTPEIPSNIVSTDVM